MRKSDTAESDSGSDPIELERLTKGLVSAKRQGAPLLAERVSAAIADVLHGLDVDLDRLSEDLMEAIHKVLVDCTEDAPEMLLVTLGFLFSSFGYSLCELGERLTEITVRVPDYCASAGMTESDSGIPIAAERLIKDLVLRKQKSALAPLLAERLRVAIADVLRQHGVDISLSEGLTNAIHQVLVDFKDEAPGVLILTLSCHYSSLYRGVSMLDKRLSELEDTNEV